MKFLSASVSFVFLATALLAAPAFGEELDVDEVDAAEVDDAEESGAEPEVDRISHQIAQRNEESAHGSGEWKPSYGAGVEAGFFFTTLERWNAYILEPNEQEVFDVSGALHFDLAVEASLLEGTRLSAFVGLAAPLSSDPSLRAYYLGVEPAFAFRGGDFELALGVGAGVGWTALDLDAGPSANTSLILVRPFLEVRRYPTESIAGYLRVGFNQWFTYNAVSDDLVLETVDHRPLESNSLSEGGFYVALGLRFGSYPEHIKYVGDSDGDGFYDDVDNCPHVADNFQGLGDFDGCPVLDNDGDGILNADDKCPNVSVVFIDGFEAHGGCPVLDVDGDGVANLEDECPLEPQNYHDGQDGKGCPMLDRDGDGIADIADHCPDVAGVPERDGCPFQRVEVTLRKIVINERVHFEYDKDTIKEESFDLLNEVAQVLTDNPRIKKIEIQGHTDHKASARYNLALSDARAKAVREYIAGRGVATDRLTSKGFGFSQPQVPLPEDGKESDEDAAKNRRVEFLILEQDEVSKVVREDEIPEDAAEVRAIEE